MIKLCTYVLLWIHVISYAAPNHPKLIVQIVIDQLRGDLIEAHRNQFGKGGFNYLLSHSINYNNAHHPHANTTTCAGHAAIATGSYPSLNGIVNNEWYDRKTKRIIYCIEDLNSVIIPTNHTRYTPPGRSPRNLTTSTISDEIILANKGKAFSVSFKDRAAITLAGHAGKAFWFDTMNGGFITSSFYYDQYPQWVKEWNNNYHPQDFLWTLNRDLNTYQNKDNPVITQVYPQFGQSFPHQIKQAPSKEYFVFLTRTPKADQLTGDFAEQLLSKEQLGTSPDETDYLAISFSAVDAIGHQFGPNSLEIEDNLLVLDETIDHLMTAINQQVGLEHTLIILTADHGAPDSPPYLKAHGIAEMAPMDVAAATNTIHAELNRRFKLPNETLMAIALPYVYLDHKIIRDHHFELTEVNEFLAQVLTNEPGVFKAYPLPSNLEKNWLSAKVARMAYPFRAGDLYLVPPPYQARRTENDDRIEHGTPWQYDTYVPLLFVHPRFKSQLIPREVYTTDIATTLATLVMIKSPSGSVGTPLTEILNGWHQLSMNEHP